MDNPVSQAIKLCDVTTNLSQIAIKLVLIKLIDHHVHVIVIELLRTPKLETVMVVMVNFVVKNGIQLMSNNGTPFYHR